MIMLAVMVQMAGADMLAQPDLVAAVAEAKADGQVNEAVAALVAAVADAVAATAVPHAHILITWTSRTPIATSRQLNGRSSARCDVP